MKKSLIAYFSCTGTTKNIAQAIADEIGGQLYEIKPAQKYTERDLDWTNKNSRSSLEMKEKSSRPGIVDDLTNLDEFEVVFVGFPIWWYTAPTIINTFLESYDFGGKLIVPFATSGGSGFGQTGQSLQQSAPKARFAPGKVLRSAAEAAVWAKSLDI